MRSVLFLVLMCGVAAADPHAEMAAALKAQADLRPVPVLLPVARAGGKLTTSGGKAHGNGNSGGEKGNNGNDKPVGNGAANGNAYGHDADGPANQNRDQKAKMDHPVHPPHPPHPTH